MRITNMSRLVAHRSKYGHSTHVCNSCLHPFTNQSTLETRIPFCLQHSPQQVQYPDPENCKLKFDNVKKQHPVSFFLVADFESFLTPTDDDDDDNDTRHTVYVPKNERANETVSAHAEKNTQNGREGEARVREKM